MKFTYMSEEDAKKALLLPAGVYDFEVIEAEERLSRKGKDMIAIVLRVFADNGSERRVNDYLMEAMRFKFIHFARTAGLDDKYKSGELSATDCMGRTGKVELVIDEQEGYQPKNAVKDYVSPKAEDGTVRSVVHAPSAPLHAATDDGIPFAANADDVGWA